MTETLQSALAPLRNRISIALVMGSVITSLEEYKKEIARERERQTEIKEKYGIRSLEQLIVRLDGDLITLQDRKDHGENVDLVMRNKVETKERYEKALVDLKDQLNKEKSLTMSMPRFRGIIRVKPSPTLHDAMETDPEIERLGMSFALDFETGNGRVPEDVSAQNLGFDIRSKGGVGLVRYSEVKARAGNAAVALTQNEWFKAKRFGDDYYLYAVMSHLGARVLRVLKEDSPYELRDIDGNPISKDEARRLVLSEYHVSELIRRERRRRNRKVGRDGETATDRTNEAAKAPQPARVKAISR